MTTRRTALGAFMAGLAAPGAMAQPAFPDRPLRLVIPFVPGGTNDIVGRLVAEGLSARLGQQVVVDNRGGAGGAIGAEIVAKAAPDGHTLLLGGTGSQTINQILRDRLPYDPATAFAPIGLVAAGAVATVVHPSLPVRNLSELQAVARQRRLAYASPGVGSSGHAAGALIESVLGIEMDHVPYRGTGPALVDVVAGRVHLFTNAVPPLQPHLRTGALRGICIAGRRRSPAEPDLPTAAEQGFPALEATGWYAILTTGGTPPDRVARLFTALGATLAEPETRRKLNEAGLEVEPSESPEAFARFLAEDLARWTPVVRGAGMRAE
ncbi:Bug family tripartite tricarboxylate transporter substrate binding protein [Muricoccus radiodurans]|uniref:Bug family tripartite tricarboxylate transporter substrate binding protein n=1 Tax=Muricoccus radiodurans TaxID=2231721 RepID=UPI003CF3572A